MSTEKTTRRTLFHRILGLGIFSVTPAAIAEAASTSAPADVVPSYARSQEVIRGIFQHGYHSCDVLLHPGETREIFSQGGPGTISQITFDLSSTDAHHLKECVLRCYWDEGVTPSVEVPVGDFFGLNLSQYAPFDSCFLACTPSKVLHSYFAMPYRRRARITIEHQGSDTAVSLHVQIFTRSVERLPDDVLYFHACYNQTPPFSLSTSFSHRHVCLDTYGEGHLIGITVGVLKTGDGHWNDRKESIYVDSQISESQREIAFERSLLGDITRRGTTAVIPYAQCNQGLSVVLQPTKDRGRYSYYRWYGEAPIAFKKRLVHSLTWTHQSTGSDTVYSTAYWYQSSPSRPSRILPDASYRLI